MYMYMYINQHVHMYIYINIYVCYISVLQGSALAHSTWTPLHQPLQALFAKHSFDLEVMGPYGSNMFQSLMHAKRHHMKQYTPQI